MNVIERDITIVGAGPAGVTLANLLAGYGISVLIIDSEPQILTEPRAVGIDDEALRTLQSFGMAETVLENAVRNAPIRYFDSKERILAHVAPSGRPYGWPRRNLFFQPNLEAVLRESLQRFDNVELMTSCEAVGLTQDADGVTVLARHDGDVFEVHSKYVVGADGGRSFVRKAVGIEMEGDTAPMKWLVVDVEHDTWDAPYSAVYRSPERPAMTIPLPFGHRRFEFKVLDGEDPESMATPEKVAELMKQFYPNSPVPPAVRRRIYWHHSRTAKSFQAGRVFVVGDAAHLQPPFFGQGMNSGIRDVTNLGWKLGMVVSGKAAPALLDTYDSERRETAKTMVEFATGIGKLYHPRNKVTEKLGNSLFRVAQKVPGGREYILQMKYKPVPRYTDGFVEIAGVPAKSSPVGRALPQPLVQLLDGSRVRLDDVLGQRIAVIALAGDVADALSPQMVERLKSHDVVIVQAHVTPAYRREGQSDPREQNSPDVVDVYDLEGGLRDLLLARPGDEVVIVRPDRYVAAVSSLSGLNSTLDRLLRRLENGSPARAAAARAYRPSASR